MYLIPTGFGAVGLILVGFSPIDYGCAPQKSTLRPPKPFIKNKNKIILLSTFFGIITKGLG
jgi:hypothetical protein